MTEPPENKAKGGTAFALKLVVFLFLFFAAVAMVVAPWASGLAKEWLPKPGANAMPHPVALLMWVLGFAAGLVTVPAIVVAFFCAAGAVVREGRFSLAGLIGPVPLLYARARSSEMELPAALGLACALSAGFTLAVTSLARFRAAAAEETWN